MSIFYKMFNLLLYLYPEVTQSLFFLIEITTKKKKLSLQKQRRLFFTRNCLTKVKHTP